MFLSRKKLQQAKIRQKSQKLVSLNEILKALDMIVEVESRESKSSEQGKRRGRKGAQNCEKKKDDNNGLASSLEI